MKKLISLLLFSALILPACSNDIEENSNPTTNEPPKINEESAPIEEIEKPESNLLTHTDPVLKLSFQYPKEWGMVETKDAVTGQGVEDNPAYRLYFYSMDSNSSEPIFKGLFLVANNLNIPLEDRDGYWGDEGRKISGVEAVDTYCKDMTVEEGGSCSTFQNTNGVKIVKYRANPASMQGRKEMSDQYLFYNPNSVFSGVIMSTIGLNDKSDPEMEKLFEEMIQSIKFTN